KTHQIPTVIQTGGQLGMITMDACLAELVLKKVITFEMGLARSVDQKEFGRLVSTGGVMGQNGGTPPTQRIGGGEVGRFGGPPPIGRAGRSAWRRTHARPDTPVDRKSTRLK